MNAALALARELDQGQWRTVFRQLVARGLLTVDVEGHGSLRLTPESGSVLRGERRLELRRERKRPAARSSRERRVPAAIDRSSPLWSALRQRRKQLADEQGVPPYVIFHDTTLVEMVQDRPATREAFARLTGVGATKLERYADAFLEVIRAHAREGPRTDSPPAPGP